MSENGENPLSEDVRKKLYEYGILGIMVVILGTGFVYLGDKLLKETKSCQDAYRGLVVERLEIQHKNHMLVEEALDKATSDRAQMLELLHAIQQRQQ